MRRVYIQHIWLSFRQAKLMHVESVTRTTVTTHNAVIFIVTGIRILNLTNTRLFYIILYWVTKAAISDFQMMASVTKYRYTYN